MIMQRKSARNGRLHKMALPSNIAVSGFSPLDRVVMQQQFSERDL